MTPIAATLLGRHLAGGRRPFPAREVYRAILNECVSEHSRLARVKRQSRECAGGDCCLAKTTQRTAAMRT
jgi:hypothetical protein